MSFCDVYFYRETIGIKQVVMNNLPLSKPIEVDFCAQLLVVNKDGSVFSYIIKYKKRLSKLNYFIPRSSSIGYERPVAEVPKPGIKKLDSVTRRLAYFKNFGDYLLKLKPRI